MNSLRQVFGEALAELGKRNSDVIVLDADLSAATRSIIFGKEFPDRFFNVGITEANMVSMAAGLASCGKIPFASTFSFLISLRAADQVRSQICYPRLNVKLVGTNGGLSGFGDGATHQCVMDLSIMRTMPGMTVIVPSDGKTVRDAVFQAAEFEGPVFIRIPRIESPQIHCDNDDWKIGKGICLRKGKDVSVVASGMMVHIALAAAEQIREQGIDAEVLELHTLKPLDEDILLQSVSRTGAAVVVEEHSCYGGLCSAVSEIVGLKHPIPLEFVAINDRFGESGQYREILASCGLTVDSIVTKTHKVLKRKIRK